MGIVTSQIDSVRSTSPFEGESLPAWQQAMKGAFRKIEDLADYLDLPQALISGGNEPAEQFPLFVPQAFAAKMEKGNPNDPLLLQVLPHSSETVVKKGFTHDPVGDQQAQLSPGLLHKYQGRALLVVTGACAVHCRYCFRRHFPYSETPKGIAAWETALSQIEADPTIEEIILSGGDPLTVADTQLAELVQRIEQISHIQRLRIHTRLPIMIPERINQAFFSWFAESRLTPIMVIHSNHSQELDSSVIEAITRMIDRGIPVLNQAVLLKGINDSANTLAELCQKLVNIRVMPYYLHQLDKVAGASHFEVDREIGKQLLQQLHARLPGYAVPRYVEEIAGEPGKTNIL